MMRVDHLTADLLVRDLGGVLGGNHDRLHPGWLAVHVLDRHLALAVRTQPGQIPAPPRLGEPPGQGVGEHDRQRHQLRRLAAGEAEHQPLIAGAAGVDSLGDVRRLAADGAHHSAALGVESEPGLRVADVADRLAGDLREVHITGRRDLARQDDEPRRDQGLAGNTAHRILMQDVVENSVGDLVADLVRDALR